MTSKIFAALFVLLISGFTLLAAQQPPQQHKSETKRRPGEQPERRDHIFDELKVTKNQSYDQSFSKDRLRKINAIIPDFLVNEHAGPNGARQSYPAISSDGNGNFVMTWEDLRNGDSDIFGQRYSSDGTVLGTNFKVNDDQGSATQWFAAISSDNGGDFVITWEDHREGYYGDIYGQCYSSDGTPLGSNFKVSKTCEKSQLMPDVELSNGRIYNTWSDSRKTGTGLDVWANVLDGKNPTGIKNKQLSQLPSASVLAQNYPNPFNPSTTISFSLRKPGFVNLTIYDMLGNEIQKLINEFKDADNYSVKFDASKLSTGIYFYQMQVDGYLVKTKKMILMR